MLKLTNTYLKGDLSVIILGDNVDYFAVATKATKALSTSSVSTMTYRVGLARWFLLEKWTSSLSSVVETCFFARLALPL
jgi:hypothetical protein